MAKKQKKNNNLLFTIIGTVVASVAAVLFSNKKVRKNLQVFLKQFNLEDITKSKK